MGVEVNPRLMKSQNQTTWKTDSCIVDLDMLDLTVLEAMVAGVRVVQLPVAVVTNMLVLLACLVNYWLELDYLI